MEIRYRMQIIQIIFKNYEQAPLFAQNIKQTYTRNWIYFYRKFKTDNISIFVKTAFIFTDIFF